MVCGGWEEKPELKLETDGFVPRQDASVIVGLYQKIGVVITRGKTTRSLSAEMKLSVGITAAEI